LSTAAAPQQLRPGEKRDRFLGAILYALCITLIAMIFLPLFAEVPPVLNRVRHFSAMSLPTFWMAGVMLRHSYAEDLGELPRYRNPRSRRIIAACFTAIGVAPLVLAAIFDL
jgi:hypothetical protein